MRPSGRTNNKLREINIKRNFTKHAEGSVLITCGDTKVICNASVSEGVPRWLKGANQGWVTAEYSMLPRATHSRVQRESIKGGPSGRTQEIQRLIGRALRSAIDLRALGENSIHVDCDVIQADGGTRCASITGAAVALYDAIEHMLKNKIIAKTAFKHFVAATSVGIYKDKAVLDLDYTEDSAAETDMNIVMTEDLEFVEIQGTAEGITFNNSELQQMLDLASQGISSLINIQKQAVGL